MQASLSSPWRKVPCRGDGQDLSEEQATAVHELRDEQSLHLVHQPNQISRTSSSSPSSGPQMFEVLEDFWLNMRAGSTKKRGWGIWERDTTGARKGG